jgi:hypothetical protein
VTTKIHQILCIAALSLVCSAQNAQPPATTEELKFFHYMLMNVSSVGRTAEGVKHQMDLLSKQFGLTAQEMNVISQASDSLNARLMQIKHSADAIVLNKKQLSDSENGALTSLADDREANIAVLTNQILSSVSTQTALRLRAPAHLVSLGTTNVSALRNQTKQK